MQKNLDLSLDLNKFLKSIKLKKQYIKQLNNKNIKLSNIKQNNNRTLNSILFYKTKYLIKEDYLVKYIIDITFSKSNTLLHVMDPSGNLKFFCSAGELHYKGKGKKARLSVFKHLYWILVSKLTFLKGKSIALHLKNVGYRKFWVIKLMKKKFFIKVVKSFNLYPYNGCRKKKCEEKSLKKKKKWPSG